jgi:hypothetical protein
LKSLEREEDTFIFLPIKFQIISEKRREERTSLETSDGKNVLFVTNLISDLMIQNSLDSNEKKVNIVKDNISEDLKGKFDRIRVVFVNETRIDVRMKHFTQSWNPIFIRDLGAVITESEKKEFSLYINEIYAKDYKLSSQKEFVSEVSVPIIYKNMTPYGYIQVNNLKPMDENHLKVIKRLAVMINEQLIKNNIFEPAKDKFIVTDMSKNGIGIVFKDRRLLRFFMKDSHVILELSLPDSNKVVMSVIVRNTIFNEGGTIKIGLEIKNIDAISEANYDELLKTIKQ